MPKSSHTSGTQASSSSSVASSNSPTSFESERSERKAQAANVIARKYRFRRHRRVQQQVNNLDISACSAQNIAEHRALLLASQHFIVNCQAPMSDGSSCSSSSSGSIPDTVPAVVSSTESISSLLTSGERQLFQFITQHLTIQTAIDSLHAIRGDSHYLGSLDEHARRGIDSYNGRTPNKQARGGDTYWVTGIAKHLNAPSLRRQDTLSINLQAMGSIDPHVLDSLWVSPHISDILRNTYSDPVLLVGTRFQLQFNADMIHYDVQRADGTRLNWRISTHQLIFAGKHVIPGLTYHFILLLRLIGGSYPQHLVDTLKSELSLEEKQQILSVAMTSVMPGWMTIEAKIPVGIYHGKPYVQIHKQKDRQVRAIKLRPCSDLQYDIIKGAKSIINNNEQTELQSLFNSSCAVENPIDPEVRHLLNFNVYDKANYNVLLRSLIEAYDPNIKTYQQLITAGAIMYPDSFAYIRMALTHYNFSLAYFIISQQDSFEATKPHENPIWWLMLEWANILTNPAVREEHPVDISSSFSSYPFRDAKISQDTPIKLYALLLKLIEKKCPLNFRFDHIKPIAQKAGQEKGFTPLDIAISTNNVAAVNILLAAGADIKLTHWYTYFHETPYCIDYYDMMEDTSIRQRELKRRELSIEMCLALSNVVSFPDTASLDQHLAERGLSLAQFEKLFNVQAIYQSIIENAVPTHAVVIVVTGLMPNGEQAVLLGKRTGTLDDELLFPGGLVEPGETPEVAGLRELYEETSLDLRAMVQSGELMPRVLLSQALDKHAQELSMSTQITIIHIELGKRLNQMYPYPQDNFKVAIIVPIRQIQYMDDMVAFYRGSFIRPSNVYLLKQLSQALSVDWQRLGTLLCHETFIEMDDAPTHSLHEIYARPENRSSRMRSMYNYSHTFSNMCLSYLSDPYALLALGFYEKEAALIAIHLYPSILQDKYAIKQLLCIANSFDFIIHLNNLKADFNLLDNQDKSDIINFYIDTNRIDVFIMLCHFGFIKNDSDSELLEIAYQRALSVNRKDFASAIRQWLDDKSLPFITINGLFNSREDKSAAEVSLSLGFQTTLRNINNDYKISSSPREIRPMTLSDLQPRLYGSTPIEPSTSSSSNSGNSSIAAAPHASFYSAASNVSAGVNPDSTKPLIMENS